MELEITKLAQSEAYLYAASVAEMGDQAARLTWQNNLKDSPDLLDTEEKREAFRDFVKDSGGWTRDEIDTWTPEKLNALCHQWIMSDVREGGADSLEDIDWREYRRNAQAGSIQGRLFYTGRKGPKRKYFFYIGN